jgi:diadenosine tetraphosphate (Ap4A) HIT family hydrolase
MGPRTWAGDWAERLAGAGCSMCANQGLEDNGFGRRILNGSFADVYLQRATPLPGYAVAIWSDGHVAEPFDVSGPAATGYWTDVLSAARAIHAHFEPAKLNFLTLGNAVPHLHTHLLARYLDDPAPGAPLPWELIETAGPMPEELFEEQVRHLRRLLDNPQHGDELGMTEGLLGDDL